MQRETVRLERDGKDITEGSRFCDESPLPNVSRGNAGIPTGHMQRETVRFGREREESPQTEIYVIVKISQMSEYERKSRTCD